MKSLKSGSTIEAAFIWEGADRKREKSLRQLLQGEGFPDSQIVVFQSSELSRLTVYTRSISKATELSRLARRIKDPALRFEKRILTRADWLDKWKEYFHIEPLGKKFLIIPVHEKKEARLNKKFPIFLDPRGDFGTGAHETTRLMIGMMEKLEGQFHSFLDVGSGTVILSIAAARMKAERISAIERERHSAATTRLNLKHNGCRKARVLTTSLEKFRAERPYDLVGANLLSQTLEENRNRLVSLVKKRGFLALSGIGKKHLTGTRKVYEKPGIRLIEQKKGRRWAALLYQKD